MNDEQFFTAVENGDLEAVRRHLKEDAAAVEARSFLGKTALMIAAENGHVALGSLLIEKGADVNAAVFEENKSGTVLESAVEFGREAMVDLLIDNGCDVNHKVTGKCIALLMAAKAGHFAIVRKLLDSGGNVNTVSGDGTTVLMDLAAFGPRHRINPEPLLLIECMARAIEAGSDVNAADRLSNTALTRAVSSANAETVRFLIEMGADPNQAASMMILSELVRYTACLEALIEGGLNKSVFLKATSTALLNGSFDSAKTMVERLPESVRDFHSAGVAFVDACRTPDMQAFYRSVSECEQTDVMQVYGTIALSLILDSPLNRFEKTEALIKAGAPVDSDFGIHDPIIKGVKTMDRKLIRLLLEAGAKVDRGDSGEWTPLMLVVGAHQARDDRTMPAKNFDDTVDVLLEMLIDAGADVNVQDDIGRTALMYCLQLYPKNVDRLLHAGADVNIRDRNGCTHLMIADRKNTEKLLRAGADVHDKDTFGRSALFYCSDPGKARMLAAASPAERDNNQLTPLMFAASRNNLAMVKWFARFPENIGAVDKNGNTALLYASGQDPMEMVEYLIAIGEDPSVYNHSGENLFLRSCRNNILPLVKLSLRYQPDVNARNWEGCTGLMYACRYFDGRLELVELLLSQGADPEIKDTNGHTALQMAIHQGIEAIVDRLTKHGAIPHR